MKKTACLLALVAVAGLMMIAAPQQADARPKYFKAFTGKYAEVKAEATKAENKCGVCHGGPKGKKKKQLSDYGLALKEALGKKNEKVAANIDAALDAVAKEKCGDDTTYGDLLKEGKLPPPHKAEEKAE